MKNFSFDSNASMYETYYKELEQTAIVLEDILDLLDRTRQQMQKLQQNIEQHTISLSDVSATFVEMSQQLEQQCSIIEQRICSIDNALETPCCDGHIQSCYCFDSPCFDMDGRTYNDTSCIDDVYQYYLVRQSLQHHNENIPR